MNEPPLRADAELEAALRRIAGALQQNRGQLASAVEKIVTVAGSEVAAKLEQKADRIAERHERRRQRWEDQRRRRDERRRAREEEGGELGKGLVFGIVAVICVLYAIREPAFFWMVFVALGFGITSASLLARAGKKAAKRVQEPTSVEEAEARQGVAEAAAARNAARTPPVAAQPVAVPPIPVPQEPPDPKVARIQTLCDKLLAELESGPPIVREVLTEPAATISGLRQACLQTARRERELRNVLEAQDEASLLRERDALVQRLSGEQDEIVRDRLEQALRALEGQLANRAELATSATRLEAENTRILYTLENLHMQLLRARTTDIGGPELGGRLREGLRELGTQIDAVAEALECASAPVGAESTTNAATTDRPAVASESSDEAQRAERAEAARRAASAQQAQRR